MWTFIDLIIIYNDLKNKNSHAYEMVDNNEIVGGVIVTIDQKTNEIVTVSYKSGETIAVIKKLLLL